MSGPPRRRAAPVALLWLALVGPLAGVAEGSGNGNSRGPSVSANGRYVAFWSVATNLSPLDRNHFQRSVFVRDLEAGRTVLASRQSAADGGANADSHSDNVALSADGRYVAFRSEADNLSGADRNRFPNLFLRDVKANRTVLVTRQGASHGGAGANGYSDDPSVSAHGRYVAFVSFADNLSDADRRGVANVFVRDLKRDSTVMVSRQSAAAGGAGADDGSREPSLSAGGRYVAFSSDASNLDPDGGGASGHVFVRDMKTDTTVLVSRQSAADGGAPADGYSLRPSISAGGRYVAFKSYADNLSDADDDRAADVFVRDMKTATTVLVSRQSAAAGGAGADADSFYPAVSGDGHHIAFQSDADNLSDADDSGIPNVFVRDLTTDTTVLVSRQSGADGGIGADGASYVRTVSADGRHVGFFSYALNLSRADQDTRFGMEVVDVFMRDLQTDRTVLVSRRSDKRRRARHPTR